MGMILRVVCLSFLAMSTVAAEKVSADYWAFWDKSDEYNISTIDHRTFDDFLNRYVVVNHPSGINRFRYGDITKADKKQLKKYIKSLASIDPREYRKAEQKAYWLNLYNALTIRQVLDEYPIASLDEKGFKHKKQLKVAGVKLSLNDIENRILRPVWQDHKVIFGLSCATVGCPNIQNQAFTSANTRKMLKRAGREFINHPRGLVFNKNEMKASRIFDWYQDDFGTNEKQLMKLFAYYAEDNKALYILGFQGEIRYAYDARVNSPDTVWPLD